MGSRHRKQSERTPAQAEQSAGSATLPGWVVLLLGVLAFAAYAHTIPYEFVHDDDTQVLKNPWIRDWSKLKEFFTTDVWRFKNPNALSNYYRPLHMALHALGYTISGLEPHGYHAINVALHALCTMLVAWIALRLTRHRFAGIAAGLIFALHPIHAESVTWIAGVTDLACAAFFFAALYFYMREGESPGDRRALVLALLCFMGALLSKEMAFTFPLVAALLDWCLHRKLRWSRYAMFAGIFAVYTALRVSALGTFHVQHNPMTLDWMTRFLSTAALAGAYLAKLVVPYDINAFHVFRPTTSVLSGDFLLATGVFAVFAAAAWLMRDRPAAVFSLGFCGITVLPVLNITGIGENVFADRYLYIPSLGVSLFIPVLAQSLAPTLSLGWRPFLRPAAGILLAALLAGYAWALSRTTFMWRDPLTLYSETLKRSPDAMLIANSLAAVHFYQGRYDEAKRWFLHALSLWEKSSIYMRVSENLYDSLSGLGAVFLHDGDLDRAQEFFHRAEQVSSGEVSLLQNLGIVHATRGDHDIAFDYYRRALEMNPRSEYTYANLAALHVKVGNYEEAAVQARKALEIHPLFGDALLYLARAYAGQGMVELAQRTYEEARRADATLAAKVDAELREIRNNRP